MQWKLPSGEPETTIQLTHGVPYRVAYSPDGRNLATVYDKGKLVIHDAVSGAKRSEFTPTDNSLHAIAFHPELTPDRRWHQYFLSLVEERK